MHKKIVCLLLSKNAKNCSCSVTCKHRHGIIGDSPNELQAKRVVHEDNLAARDNLAEEGMEVKNYGRKAVVMGEGNMTISYVYSQ